MRRAFWGAIALLVLLLAWQSYFRYRSSVESGSVAPISSGDSVPDLVLSGLEAGWAPVHLRSLAAEDCVVFYFFDPSCPASRAGAEKWPEHTSVWATDSLRVVYWIGVGGHSDSARHFLETYRIRFSAYQYSAPGGVAARALGLRAVPTAWGVSRGVVRFIATGALSTSPEALTERLSWCNGP